MPLLSKDMISRTWRAVIEFDMIQKDDRILIGLSGGKDSMFMTACLAQIKKHVPFSFELFAFTVDPGFSDDFPIDKLQNFCQTFKIEHYTEKVPIVEMIKDKKYSPCFTCAYFRRAATNRMAQQLNCNKIALAHHNDDAVETFFMNIVTSGQLRTFLPVTYLSKTNLHVIRPLLYYKEQEIKQHIQTLKLQPIKNPCPYDTKTMRQEIKEYLPKLNQFNQNSYENLNSAMRMASNIELWPAKISKKEREEKFYKFWQKNKS